MTGKNNQLQRLAIITNLIEGAPGGLGRTALMKCLFFLKVLRNVPLPYSFRLYTYGPFDTNVLDDLRYAESLGAISSSEYSYPGGYGYLLHAGPNARKIAGLASDFVEKHRESVDWVVREFGRRSALDLEMASTLVYIDRALAESSTTVTIAELSKRVHDVKPHLSTEQIEEEAQKLYDQRIFRAIT